MTSQEGQGGDGARLAVGRGSHRAVLLQDGRVLAVGGLTLEAAESNSVEVYDPSSRRWTAAAPLRTPRRLGHSATLLPDGRVLVAGGTSSARGGSVYHASAELYDPAADRWSPAASMAEARRSHSATLLRDGRVLVAGGTNSVNPGDRTSAPLASTELYDPARDRWASAGMLWHARERHRALLLPDGRVLVGGGLSCREGTEVRFGPLRIELGLSSGCYDASPTAELYDPVAGAWRPTGRSQINQIAWLALLPSGQVLNLGDRAHDKAELYDPERGQWRWLRTEGAPNVYATLVLLADGRVLASGAKATDSMATYATAQLFDPASGVWSPTGSLRAARFGHTATVLRDGRVLVAGGGLSNGTRVLPTELYDPATGVWSPAGG